MSAPMTPHEARIVLNTFAAAHDGIPAPHIAMAHLVFATALCAYSVTDGDAEAAKGGVREMLADQVCESIDFLPNMPLLVEHALRLVSLDPKDDPAPEPAPFPTSTGTVIQPFTDAQAREIDRMRNALTRSIRGLCTDRGQTIPMVITALGNAVADILAQAGEGQTALLDTHVSAFHMTVDSQIAAVTGRAPGSAAQALPLSLIHI